MRFSDGEIVKYDILITAMPLDKLCNDVINGEMPREIKKAAASLRHSGGYMVGIGIKQPCPSTKSLDVLPREATARSIASRICATTPRYMTPDNNTHYSLLCETSYSEFKPVDGEPIVDDTIQGLINAGLLKEKTARTSSIPGCFTPSTAIRRRRSSATRFSGRRSRTSNSTDIYSRGRFGMWKYEVSNTDHTLMQGVELVNRLLLGEPEATIGIKYESTNDGRQAAAHERSVVAGSGDPAKLAALKNAKSGKSPENGKVKLI